MSCRERRPLLLHDAANPAATFPFLKCVSTVTVRKLFKKKNLVPHLTDCLFNRLLAGHDNVSDLVSVTFGRRRYE